MSSVIEAMMATSRSPGSPRRSENMATMRTCSRDAALPRRRAMRDAVHLAADQRDQHGNEKRIDADQARASSSRPATIGVAPTRIAKEIAEVTSAPTTATTPGKASKRRPSAACSAFENTCLERPGPGLPLLVSVARQLWRSMQRIVAILQQCVAWRTRKRVFRATDRPRQRLNRPDRSQFDDLDA